MYLPKVKLHLTKSTMKKTLKRVAGVIRVVVVSLLVMIAGFVFISTLKIPGNYKMLVVLSGSMEPVLSSGDIIVIKPQDSYKPGDIITVSDPGNIKVTVTHRIYDIEEKNGSKYYITKGDANDSADTEKRPADNVLGKTLFSIPYLGYPVSFARSRNGLILLIIIPATVVVYGEILSIKKELQKLLKERKKKANLKSVGSFKIYD